MNSISREERLGRKIVRELWPEIQLEFLGSINDRDGIDGWLHSMKVQIKYDRRIEETGNIWDEHYEKSKGKPWQTWRKCKRNAHLYIFTSGGDLESLSTEGSLAIMVPLEELDNRERDRQMIEIPKEGATSKGYLIAVPDIDSEIKFIEEDNISWL